MSCCPSCVGQPADSGGKCCPCCGRGCNAALERMSETAGGYTRVTFPVKKGTEMQAFEHKIRASFTSFAEDQGQADERQEWTERLLKALARIPLKKVRDLAGELERYDPSDLDDGQTDDLEEGSLASTRNAARAFCGDEEEAKKVSRHAEKFSEQFAKIGTTKEDLVAGFKAARKYDNELTADKFLGVNAR